MYNAEFTEFSYGFAITDNFMHSGIPHTSKVPSFPSLKQEGKAGGYDVEIPLRPVPLFLQFKIPQVVGRRSDKMPNGFWTPYFRMHLRTKRPNQHDLLQKWENVGNLVFYVTPDFCKTRELDEYFSNKVVHEKSWYVRPSQIGPLDNRPHHLAYQKGDRQFWLCSEPKALDRDFSSEAFSKRVELAISEAEPQDPLAFIERISAKIEQVTRRRAYKLSPGPILPWGEELRELEAERLMVAKEFLSFDETAKKRRRNSRKVITAVRRATYLAQSRLGCALAIVGRNE